MPFGFGNAYDITSAGMHYADPKAELVHKSWNSETLPIVSKQKWKSFAFPLPDSYLLRLEQLFPSTIYIIGHGCCAVVGESAVCRYYINGISLTRHNFTTWTKPNQHITPPHFSFFESFQKTFFRCQKLHHCIHLNLLVHEVVQGVRPINLFEVSKPSVTWRSTRPFLEVAGETTPSLEGGYLGYIWVPYPWRSWNDPLKLQIVMCLYLYV